MANQGPAWVYSEKLKEHFMNPKNVLQDDENFKEDGKGTVGNIKCGDEMVVLKRPGGKGPWPFFLAHMGITLSKAHVWPN